MSRTGQAQSTSNWIMSVLSLWSMVSLVVIVVWTTWLPWSSVKQCKAAQHNLLEKIEGAKVVREKELVVLNSTLQQSSENQTRQQEELWRILELREDINAALTESLQLHRTLQENISALENTVILQQNEHSRLSSELTQQEALVEKLSVSFQSESHRLESCVALCDAVRSQQAAAEALGKVCQSQTIYLSKQINICKTED